MTEMQEERLLSLLERIAVALEASGWLKVTTTTAQPVQPAMPAVTPSMYQCTRCLSWITYGNYHSCYPGNTSGGHTVLGSAGSDPSRCTFMTAANMRCTLDAHHSSGHNIGV